MTPSTCRALPLFAALLATGCVVHRLPLALPARSTPYVAVLSGEMPEPITPIARHAWIIANAAKSPQLRRYELLGSASARSTDDPFDYFGEGETPESPRSRVRRS